MDRENTWGVVSLCLLVMLLLTAMAQAQVNNSLRVPTVSSIGVGSSPLSDFRTYSSSYRSRNYPQNVGSANAINAGAGMPQQGISNHSSRQRFTPRINHRINSRITTNQRRPSARRTPASSTNRLGPSTRIPTIRSMPTSYNTFTRNPDQLGNPTAGSTNGFNSTFVSREQSSLSYNPYQSRQSVMTSGSRLSQLQGLGSQQSWLTGGR